MEATKTTAVSATKISQAVQEVFAAEHEYRVVKAADYPKQDHAWYDNMAQRLRPKGFRVIADIEDATVTRATPNLRTFIRAVVLPDGSIRGGFYHVHAPAPTLVFRILQLIGLVPRNLRVLDFTTELADGTFVMTTNAPTGSQFQHGVRFDTHYAAKMPPLELLVLHEQRVARRVAANHTTVVPATTFDAMLASVCRMDRARAEHRASVGWVTRDEMRAVAGPRLSRTSDTVYDAMQTGAPGDQRPG